MPDWLFDAFMGNPTGIALVGAHFLLFSIPAWLIVAWRVAGRRITAREWLVLGAFCAFILLEIMQLQADRSFLRHELWGLSRYFGVFAPLLWLWLAKALADLWQGDYPRFVPAPKITCRVVRGLVCVLLAVIAYFYGFDPISAEISNGASKDAMVAARRIARTIKADYAGPSRQAQQRDSLNDYFTTRRPVVYGNYSAAAWCLRTQSEGAVQGKKKSPCPYPDDYLFIRAGSGYGDLEKVDPAKYDIIAKVHGLGTEWRLFRRKTVPHRLPPLHRASSGLSKNVSQGESTSTERNAK